MVAWWASDGPRLSTLTSRVPSPPGSIGVAGGVTVVCSVYWGWATTASWPLTETAGSVPLSTVIPVAVQVVPAVADDTARTVSVIVAVAPSAMFTPVHVTLPALLTQPELTLLMVRSPGSAPLGTITVRLDWEPWVAVTLTVAVSV